VPYPKAPDALNTIFLKGGGGLHEQSYFEDPSISLPGLPLVPGGVFVSRANTFSPQGEGIFAAVATKF